MSRLYHKTKFNFPIGTRFTYVTLYEWDHKFIHEEPNTILAKFGGQTYHMFYTLDFSLILITLTHE